MIKAIDYISINVPNGYIAGDGDGIVTVAGQPKERFLWVFDAETLVLIRYLMSLSNGHYLIMGLDPNKHYLVMCRDHERQYEPFCWDYVRPATDLTFAEQLALWQSWQS